MAFELTNKAIERNTIREIKKILNTNVQDALISDVKKICENEKLPEFLRDKEDKRLPEYLMIYLFSRLALKNVCAYSEKEKDEIKKLLKP